MLEVKSNLESDNLRADGNKFYSQKKFFDALLKYNQSLCSAVPGSENVGLAYANRSAIYFEVKLYENCLKNIRMAKKSRYPEKSLEVLTKRKEKCVESMGKQSDKLPNSWDFFKLSYPPNKKLPFIVDYLEVKQDEKYGRHIITHRDLKVGDVVSIEKPFSSILISESKFLKIPELNIYQRCSNCLKENALDLMPCDSCCKGEPSRGFKNN